MNVTQRTGGQLLIDCLCAQGVTTGFGVPGESYLAVLDAMVDVADKFEFVICRNEGGAAFMAEAWGKLTGEPGVCFVTRGPGATNAAIGVHTARQDSTPMVLFVGQVATDQKEREAFQEIDYRSFYRDVAKWATEIEDVNRIPEMVARAFTVARSGRPGPVVVALPEDVLVETTCAETCAQVQIAEPAVDSQILNTAMELLESAQKPLVLIGGGGWRRATSTRLQTFVEGSQLPVVSAFRFNDLLDNNSPCFVGEAGVAMRPFVREAISQADVILALGIRFGEMTTDAYTLFDCPQPQQKIIHVHPSDGELGKIYQAEMPIQSGVNAFVSSLGNMSLMSSASRDKWCDSLRKSFLESLSCPPQPGGVDMGVISAWLRDRLPTDTVVTNGAGNFTIWPNKFLLYGSDMRLLAPQSGAMGYGLPAAVAAKVANRERTVICFAGDGDLQMNIQELGTAMQAGAQPIVLLLNNRMYGTIRMH
ncbi:MAG: thiamine pyrophosphate-binding protein, partial [Pseudomonadota bacterium]